jgi:hypothetical protein
MDAEERFRNCLIRDCQGHIDRMPLTFVVLQIDEDTPADALAHIKAALNRAAAEFAAQHLVN